MRLFETPQNPAPPDGEALAVTTRDGVRLRAARWRARLDGRTAGRQGGAARGTIALLPGRAEYIEKYYEVAAECLARGYEVVALDWRGQGLSERALSDRTKGHVDDFSLYGLDLSAFAAQVLPASPRPWLAIAHSMGAAALLSAMSGEFRPFERVAFSAPMIEIGKMKHPRRDRRLVEALDLAGFGAFRVPGQRAAAAPDRPFAGNDLTGDPARFARNAAVLAAAPELAVGAPTIGWLHAALRRTEAFADPAFARSVVTPALALAGEGDAVVRTAASERFFSRLRAGRLIVLEGARHEIFQETDDLRAQAWAAIDAFFAGESSER